jgi:hypothetical protein
MEMSDNYTTPSSLFGHHSEEKGFESVMSTTYFLPKFSYQPSLLYRSNNQIKQLSFRK